MEFDIVAQWVTAHDESHLPICKACLSVWGNGLYNKSPCRACSGFEQYGLPTGGASGNRCFYPEEDGLRIYLQRDS